MKAKYVIFQALDEDGDGIDRPIGIVFDQYTDHKLPAVHHANMKPISAGFCSITQLDEAVYEMGSTRSEQFKCWGHSVSLQLHSRPEEDEKILNYLLLG